MLTLWVIYLVLVYDKHYSAVGIVVGIEVEIDVVLYEIVGWEQRIEERIVIALYDIVGWEQRIEVEVEFYYVVHL